MCTRPLYAATPTSCGHMAASPPDVRPLDVAAAITGSQNISVNNIHFQNEAPSPPVAVATLSQPQRQMCIISQRHRQMCTRPLDVAAAITGSPAGCSASLLGMAVKYSEASRHFCAPLAASNSATPRFMSPVSTASPAGLQAGRKGTTQRPVLLLCLMTRCGKETKEASREL